MNIKSLRVFAHIMEFGTLARASAELHLSPPAVSRLLRLLEEELDTVLFDRIKKRLVPTSSGERLYPEAVRILAALDGIPDFLGQTGKVTDKPLRVICHPRTVNGLVLPAIKRLVAERPEARVRLEVQARQNFGNYVAQEQFHLGIGSLPAPWSKTPSEEICETELGVLLKGNHPLAQLSTLTAEGLVTEPYIALTEGTHVRQLVNSHLLQTNVQWKPVHEVSISSASAQMVRDGLGFTVTERVSLGAELPEGLRLIPLRPAAMLKVGLFRSTEELQHPLSDALSKQLRKIGAELMALE